MTIQQQPTYLASELVALVRERSKGRLDARLSGEDVVVKRFMPPQSAGTGDMAFLTDARYADAMKASAASLVILREKDCEAIFGSQGRTAGSVLLCEDPYAFFAFASQLLFPVAATPGIHPRAYVEEGAEVDPTAAVEALAVVKRGARIGARAVVRSGAYVGEDVQIGAECLIHPNAVLEAGTILGDRCVVQAGAVLGGDGFGFAPFRGEWVKIPQVGRTVLGDDVEVGANTTIDRGALDDTVVGEGTKLDNQIQLGHNDRIGKHCVMAACVGIAGSTTVGDHAMIGGAAMINGHITIPSGSAVGPATAITGWGEKPAQRTGFFPALEGKDFQLTAATLTRLPQLRKDLKALEREVAELKALIRKEEA